MAHGRHHSPTKRALTKRRGSESRVISAGAWAWASLRGPPCARRRGPPDAAPARRARRCSWTPRLAARRPR
eukprot:8139553-Pyramimonas_sp.AAC.1